jgi:hypothetical protein
VPEGVSSADGLGGNQDQTWPRSGTSANDEAKHRTEKGPEDVVVKQNKAQSKETKIRVDAVANFQQQPNWAVRSAKPDHSVPLGPVQREVSKSTTPETAPALRWCPPRLMHSQRRRIQRMRVHKLKEDMTEKERDEHLNTIQHMFPIKQEWRVKEKEKVSIPIPMTFDDDMDLLDDVESPLIKDGSPPPISMDINMVFTLSVEFWGAKEVA